MNLRRLLSISSGVVLTLGSFFLFSGVCQAQMFPGNPGVRYPAYPIALDPRLAMPVNPGIYVPPPTYVPVPTIVARQVSDPWAGTNPWRNGDPWSSTNMWRTGDPWSSTNMWRGSSWQYGVVPTMVPVYNPVSTWTPTPVGFVRTYGGFNP